MNNIKYDYSKLRGRIKEKLGSEKEFAKQLGISHSSISAKLNGYVPFSQHEIDISVKLLQIEETDIQKYFFTQKVEK